LQLIRIRHHDKREGEYYIRPDAIAYIKHRTGRAWVMFHSGQSIQISVAASHQLLNDWAQWLVSAEPIRDIAAARRPPAEYPHPCQEKAEIEWLSTEDLDRSQPE
jgi:hypothetical protein